MASHYRLSRRRFLQAGAAAAVSSSLVSCGGSGPARRFFTGDEARAVAAIGDRIVPPDGDPGAAALGVVEYLDRQLVGPLRDLQVGYRAGLAAVDAESRARGGKPFADLPAEAQDAVLAAIEKGEVKSDWKGPAPKDFFGLIADHTLQSFYGDPRHGGNRDGASWKMLAIPVPPVRGREHADGVPARRR